MNIEAMYRIRFEAQGLEKRNRVWRVLCGAFFDRLIGQYKDVLELACGYGEFINNISARSKIGVDINQDSRHHLASDVRFVNCPATEMATVQEQSVDVVFASNFLEHLTDKGECDRVFAEVKRVLRIGGRFIVMGPNIRYAYKQYWDFYDHHLPLSHLSLEEGLTQAGFKVTRNIPRFLPFSMKSSVPTAGWLIELYLRIPLAWRFMGKQFLVVAEKP